MKIKTTKITIRRAEGPTALQRPIDFVGGDCWTQASDWLTAMAPTFPVFGCDKHDLAIEWEDGEVYRGRMDCTATGSLDVARHVRTDAEFVAGLYRPAWMTDGQWELCCSRHELKRDEARSFLDTYQIGD